MRLAAYNVENLFTRARALNLATWADGRAILEAYTDVNKLFEKDVYTDADKTLIVQLLARLGLDKKDEGRFAILRKNRGELLKRSVVGGPGIVAQGRADWVGWVELKTELVDEQATRNTAQVVRDVGADVLAVCEAEGRSALLQFSNVLVPQVGGERYEHVMLIDGNDERGIDVGLMTSSEYPIVWMRSHVDDKSERGGLVFSRDCAEYLVWTPSGQRVWMLVNHFKSKGYGAQEASDARRRQQAQAVRDIYRRLRAEGETMIAVAGDLNDHPGSAPLDPLLAETDLVDVSQSPAYQDDGHPGTYQNGTARDKIDYLLASPELFGRIKAAGVWRKGVWGGKNGTRWPIYAEMQREEHGASDHAAIWCDVEV
jgi:endonuclease/exonuclease/phosphatase family metal-dependent hydrolase